MRIYFNEFFEIHFINNGTNGKDHDITKQFCITNRTLGTVEGHTASFAHAVSYCNLFADDWVSATKDTRGQFDPEIQGDLIQFEKAES